MSDPAPILEQLKIYQAKWQNESATARRFIDFISTYPDCFSRTLKIGHVTGSAWVVNKAGTHFLLTHHKKLNKWFQLGGHADGDSDILRVAQREVLEESGLTNVVPLSDQIFDLDIHGIPENKKEAAHDHYDIRYAFQVTEHEEYIVSGESHDLSWVEITNLSNYTTDDSMVRMAKKWQARQRHAVDPT